MDAEVDQRAAAGLGLREHPRAAEIAVPLHPWLVEPHEAVRQRAELAAVAHRDGRLGEPAVAERHRHRRPRLLRFREIGQLADGLRVDPPGLLHQERNPRLDQKTKLRRHRRMMSERDDELRLRLLDHRAVVGERRAAVLPRPLRGHGGIRRVNAGDVELLALQDPQIVGRRGGVIVIRADHRHALRPPAGRLREGGCRKPADGQRSRLPQQATTGRAVLVQPGNYSDRVSQSFAENVTVARAGGSSYAEVETGRHPRIVDRRRRGRLGTGTAAAGARVLRAAHLQGPARQARRPRRAVRQPDGRPSTPGTASRTSATGFRRKPTRNSGIDADDTFIYIRGYPSKEERDKRLKAAHDDPEFAEVVLKQERDPVNRLIVKAHNIDMVPSGPQTAIAIKP